MTTMIEKVARAIGNDLYGHCDPNDTPNTWKSSVDLARAAIEAMREPNAAMMMAFNEDALRWFNDEIDDEYHLYKVMIDAALAEEEPK